MELIHRRGAAWGLFLTVLALTSIGIVMVYSASSVGAQAQFRDSSEDSPTTSLTTCKATAELWRSMPP